MCRATKIDSHHAAQFVLSISDLKSTITVSHAQDERDAAEMYYGPAAGKHWTLIH